MAWATCRPRVGACSFGKARDHEMRRQEAAGERAKTARERKEEGKKEKEEEVRSCPRGSVGLVFGHSLTDKGQQEEERRKKGKGAARRAKAAEDKRRRRRSCQGGKRSSRHERYDSAHDGSPWLKDRLLLQPLFILESALPFISGALY